MDTPNIDTPSSANDAAMAAHVAGAAPIDPLAVALAALEQRVTAIERAQTDIAEALAKVLGTGGTDADDGLSERIGRQIDELTATVSDVSGIIQRFFPKHS